jgi:hypothetical protein
MPQPAVPWCRPSGTGINALPYPGFAGPFRAALQPGLLRKKALRAKSIQPAVSDVPIVPDVAAVRVARVRFFGHGHGLGHVHEFVCAQKNVCS